MKKKEKSDILSTFYNEQYITRYSINNKKNKNSFLSKLNNTDIIYNNTMLKLKKKYFKVNNITVNPEKILNQNKETSSNSTPSIYIQNFNKIYENTHDNRLIVNKMNSNIDKIVNMITSSKFDKKKFLKEETDLKTLINNEKKNKMIDPKYYIKTNFQKEPNNITLFKSYKKQVEALGNEKYRNALFKGLNDYELKSLKYSSLKGPTGYNKNKSLDKPNNTNKEIKQLILDMEECSFNYYNTNNNINKGRNNLPLIRDFHTYNKLKLTRNETLNERLLDSMVMAKKTLNHFIKRNKEYEKMKENISNYYKNYN